MANDKSIYFFKCKKKDHGFLKPNLNLIVCIFCVYISHWYIYIFNNSEHRAGALFNAKSGHVKNSGTEVENIFAFFYASVALFYQVTHARVHKGSNIYKLYFT